MHMFSMSLFKYFKLVRKSVLSSLWSPSGYLAHTIPFSSAIAAENEEVPKVLLGVTEHPAHAVSV